MLTIKGKNSVIENALRIKGVPYEQKPGEGISLSTKEMELTDEDTIIHYLDERFPVPQLISGDVDNRARIKMLYKIIQKEPDRLNEIIGEAKPFIFGPYITLVDLLAYEHCNDDSYKKRIERVIHESA